MQTSTAGTNFQRHPLDVGTRLAATALEYRRLGGGRCGAVTMYPASHHRTHWPNHLASIGAIRFARRSSNLAEAVRFYRDLVGLPLYETFEASYGSNGAIFGLPSWNLTMEIVESTDPVAVDHHEQLCLYFPDKGSRDAAIARLRAAGAEPVEQHPYWAATGAVTYRDPDGREVVFAPFVYGVNEPDGSGASGKHEQPKA